MAKIIVVDDDANFCALAVRWLRRAGMEADCHTTPFGAVNAIRKGGFDLVILDISMPGLDGPALVRLLRETRGLQRTKILLCSFREEDSLRTIAEEAGVKAWIVKTASQNEFVGAAISALSASS